MVFTAVKSLRDGSTVGPEILPGTQASLREDIVSVSRVMGISHLGGTEVQGRKKPRDRGLDLFALLGLHLRTPQPSPYAGIKTVGL